VITIGMIVLNEEKYIGLNLAQHYDIVDKIVIVEGADKLYPKSNVTSDGLSSDATASIIKEFPDPEKKITFLQHGWTRRSGANAKCELRNHYMELVGDGILVAVDADEFYVRSELKAVIDRIQADKKNTAWRYPSMHYWKTTSCFITGGYYDVEHIRFWKVRANDRYVRNHNFPERNGRPLQDLGLVRNNRRVVSAGSGFTIAGPVCHHFGFCKSAEDIRDKNQYYRARGEAKTRPTTLSNREAWFSSNVPPKLVLHDFGGTLPDVFNVSAITH